MNDPQAPAPHPLAPPPAPQSAPVPPNPAGVMVTAEDLAELREMRAERAERAAREEAERAEAEARLTPPTHHVHLSDGQVVEGSQLGTVHTFGDGTGHPSGDRALAVAAVAPIL